MVSSLVIALPAVADADRRETFWWAVEDGRVAEHGADAGWLDRCAGGEGPRPRLVGLAPAACVRLDWSDLDGTAITAPQAAAAACSTALDRSLGDPETLHVVGAVVENGRRQALAAVVAGGQMTEWLAWANMLGVDLDHVVPVAALMPASDHWTSATIGSERLVGRRGLVLPDESSLTEAVVAGADVVALDPKIVDGALAAAAAQPPLDLRTGRFVRRRRWKVDRGRVRELLVLAGVILALSLLLAVAAIVRLERSSSRLDTEARARAEAALGRPVTIETAEAELRRRAGTAGQAGFSATLAVLLRQLQHEGSVAATAIGYPGDGSLEATLAAPALDAVNRILVAVQRDGFKVTAVPRQSADGRAVVDVTIRSGP